MSENKKLLKKVDFPCPICGSNDYKVVLPDTIGNNPPSFGFDFSQSSHNLTYRIVQCKNCTHGYASPRPMDMSVEYGTDSEDPFYMDNKEQRLLTNRQVIKEVLKFRKSGRLLDIGCATGDFISVAKDYFEVEGIELSKWSSKVAKERGLVVHNKLLSEMQVSEPYDLITLWAVIEHFEYPKKEVENVSRLLKKGGLVFVWTGDMGSITARLLGRKWWYCLSQHIQMFTEPSITELFKKCGFDKIYTGRFPYVATMRSLNNTFKRYPLFSALTQPILNSKFFSKFSVTVKLPGEMLTVFEKKI